jgi:ribonuclease P protein component
VISRKISKLATVRNRLKRQIREVLRRETEIEASQDQLVVRVLAAEKKMSYRNIREEILTLLKKA